MIGRLAAYVGDMRPVSTFLSIFLAIALITSPMASAMSPEPAGMLAKVTICHEGAAKELWVDGQGAPVKSHHDCLECCLSLVADLAKPAASIIATDAFVVAYLLGQTSGIDTKKRRGLNARGPPLPGF